MTADKVFPWYVKQSMIEGYTFLIISVTALVLGILAIFFSHSKVDFEEGNRYVPIFVSGVS